MEKLVIPDNYRYIAALITMKCNLDCSFCLNAFSSDYFDRNAFQQISGDKWIEGLNRIESKNNVPITFSGGEPFVHKDFIYILKNLKPELKIDILTNLQWGGKGIEKFIEDISPERINRDSPYPSIRISYHPEQMGDGEELVQNAKRLQDVGFRIGIYGVQYPSSKQLEALTKMQFKCINNNIPFRIKDYTGKFQGRDDNGNEFSITYGDYSKYPESCFSKKRNCKCKTSELLIGPNGDIYRCHRDMFAGEGAIGNILDKNYSIEDKFRECKNYGNCHPCDVKVKTNNNQQLGHTSVEIIDIN